MLIIWKSLYIIKMPSIIELNLKDIQNINSWAKILITLLILLGVPSVARLDKQTIVLFNLPH